MKEIGPIDIPWPKGGLVVNQAYDKQPPGTTPQAVNVRSYDPRTGRDRGGQRSGLTKYYPSLSGFPGGITGPIQNINHLSTTFNANQIGNGQFDAMESAGGSIILSNSGGGFIAQFGSAGDTLTCSTWDSNGNLYIGILAAGGGTLKVVRIDSTPTVRWTVTISVTNASRNRVYGMAVTSGGPSSLAVLYVAVRQNDTTAQIYRYDPATGTSFDGGSPWKSTGSDLHGVFMNGAVSVSAGTYNNVLAVAGNFLGVLQTNVINTAITFDIINLNNSVTSQYTGLALPITAGLGDLTSDGNSFFYLTNPTGSLAKISIAGDFEWNAAGFGSAATSAESVAFDPVDTRLGVCGPTNMGGTGHSFATINLLTGAVITSLNPGAIAQWDTVRPNGSGGFVLWRQNAANNVMGLTSALGTSFGPSGIGGSTHVGCAVNLGAPVLNAGVLSNRVVRGLLVCLGSVFRFSTSGVTFVGALGGSPINSAAVYVASAQIGQRMYYVDGLHYTYYDPTLDATAPLIATQGSLPVDNYGYAARLAVNWRTRLVVSGLPYDPANYFMSAIGDPTNWNYNPTPAVETQAIAGNLSSSGAAPDIINCLIPYSDEILLFGGDHTIYQMTGDPGAGGRIDLVTDSIGMAFGEPWCRAPDGTLFFFSSRGSVYVWVPGGIPQRISDPISELLITVNQAQTLVRMAWDERQRGCHLFLTNILFYPNSGASLHYFYDAVNKGWWQDQFGQAFQNPSAVHVFDGDSSGDRVVLMGGFDAFIRKWDQSASTDDGFIIASNIFLGPIRDKNAANGFYIADLQCDLDTGSNSINYSIYADRDAQSAISNTLGNQPVVNQNVFLAGRNRSQAIRTFGHAQYVQLLQQGTGTWAIESIRARLRVPDGQARERIF